MSMEEANNTIYIRDLNEGVCKSEMKQALYLLCSNYGPLLELTLLKTQRLRGQAFVVFAHASSAAHALAGMHKMQLFGRSITLEYARTKTRIIPSKRDAPDAKPEEGEMKVEGAVRAHRSEGSQRVEGMEVVAPQPAPRVEQPRPQLPRLQQSRRQEPPVRAPPNKVLFVQNLPADVTLAQLEEIFSLCAGNRGLAFVEFVNERDSSMALNKYHGYQLGQFLLAKKSGGEE